MSKYILKKEEIDAMQGARHVHFLNANAVRLSKSLGDLTGLTGLGFHIVEIAAGEESTEYHFHLHEDECVYILQGVGEVQIGNDVSRVSAGDFIGYRAGRSGGLPHTMKNVGDDILKYIMVGQRLPHDVCEYPNQNKRLYSNRGQSASLVDVDKVKEISR